MLGLQSGVRPHNFDVFGESPLMTSAIISDISGSVKETDKGMLLFLLMSVVLLDEVESVCVVFSSTVVTD